MEDWGHWDHYVSYYDWSSRLWVRERCLGMGTALARAEQLRQLGFDKVTITHRRFSRHKSRASRVYDS